MHRLIYTSTAKVMLSEDELGQILLSARRHNARADTTGILVYHEGRFLQVLEGLEAQVRACYKRVRADARHYDCISLGDEAVAGRLFNHSWMAYSLLADLNASQQRQFSRLGRLADVEAKAKGPLTDDGAVNLALLAFLSGFRDLQLAG